jgi:hypothetical protein
MSCLHFGDVDPPRDFYTTDQRTNEPTVTQQLSLVHTSNGSSVLFVWLYVTRRSTLEKQYLEYIFSHNHGTYFHIYTHHISVGMVCTFVQSGKKQNESSDSISTWSQRTRRTYGTVRTITYRRLHDSTNDDDDDDDGRWGPSADHQRSVMDKCSDQMRGTMILQYQMITMTVTPKVRRKK